MIVGGDGVIPMAAVPDLTEYSNESTFAREILSAGKSNSVSGTVGSGYLLSDDPYATDAGISILGGDHELYVPERNIGRLVETADEIIGQLVNFNTYGGRLDPSTFNDTAAVTGYDFLDDGSQAITDRARSGGIRRHVTPRGNGRRPESLLAPSCGTATHTSGCSPERTIRSSHRTPTTTSNHSCRPPRTMQGSSPTPISSRTGDVKALDTPPVSSLIFTVGCHGGLSVSDVQLGLTGSRTLDWAQLNGARHVTSTSPTRPTDTATPRSSPTPSGSRSCSPPTSRR